MDTISMNTEVGEGLYCVHAILLGFPEVYGWPLWETGNARLDIIHYIY